jgi:hypothetical protein
MSNDDNKIRTGLWKNEEGKPAGYGGKVTITEPGEYFVNLYKNERKETDRHPDLNLVFKPKGAATQQREQPKPSAAHDIDDLPF